MTKRKRWLLGVPLGILVALVLFFALVFDWSWLKGLVEDQASAALGRRVEITGDLDVDLDLDLTPKITVEGVRVANAPWAGEEPLAEIGWTVVEVDLMAMIGGEIVLPEVDIDAPTLRLARSAEGESNWALGGGGGGGGGASIPVIGDLQVSDTTVRYVDHGTGAERTAELATIEGALPEQGEQRLVASGEVDGEDFSLTVTAASRSVLERGGEPAPFALDLEIGDDAFTVAGSAADLLAGDGVNASLQLESPTPSDLLVLLGLPVGELAPLAIDAIVTSEGDTVRFDDLDATLGNSDLQGSGSVTLGGGPLQITGDLHSSVVDLEQIRALWAAQEQPADEVAGELSEAQQALEAAKSGDTAEPADGPEPNLPFSFEALPEWTVDVAYQADLIRAAEGEIRNLDATWRLEDQVPFLRATGSGSYGGQEATLDARLGPDEDAAADAPYPVRVQAQAGATRVDLEGTVEEPVALTGIDLRLNAGSDDLNRLLETAGIQAPEIPPFEVVGHLQQQDQVWSLDDLLARVGDSQVQGSASFDRSAEPPRLTADVTSSRLIAADFMPAEDPEESQEESEEDGQEEGDVGAADGGGTPLIGPDGINLDALPDLDVDIHFAGDYLEVPDFRFEPLRFDLAIVDKIPVLSASGQGTFRDQAAVDFEARIGSEDFIADREAPYPFDVQLTAGDTRLTADGTVAEPGTYTGLDVDVALEGPNLDQLGKILQISLPDTPPYSLSGALTHQEQRWTLDGLDGRVGDSDLRGTFTVDFGQDRPTILADLQSRDLDFDDLGPLIGGEPVAGTDETASERQAREAAIAAAESGIFPDDPLDVPDLRAMDARVTFTSDNVDARNLPLEEVTIDLTLEDGTLRLEPLKFKIAGGELVSTIVLDARPKPIEARFDVTARRLDLQQVLRPFDIEFSQLDTQREGRGSLFGRADLETSGNSIKAMAAAADGKVAVMMDGGQINALIVEGLGLDVGEALGLILDDEKEATMVAVNCFVADFDVASGRMQTRALVLDTEDSKITGAGEILLGEESLDLTLKAQARDPSVLSAGTPIRIHGPLADPTIEVVSEELVEKGLAAAALGVVLPVVGAVLPFIETSEKVPSNCGPLLEQAEKAAGSGKAGDN